MARYVVGLDDASNLAMVVAAIEHEGASRVDVAAFQRLGAIVADFPDELEADRLVSRLAEIPGVQYAEPAALREMSEGE